MSSPSPSPPHSDLPPSDTGVRHSFFDDLQAQLAGVLLVALSILLFQQAGLLTGGVTGLSFLLHYATGVSFGVLFFVLNLPCYVFAWKVMGRRFTLRTFASVALLSGLSEAMPYLIRLDHIDPIYATVMGGLLAGAGILMLIRHGFSLGGLTIIALYLQKQRGWRAGWVQMAMDCVILVGALFVVPLHLVALSVLGALVLNVLLAVNHRPGRYVGT